MKSPSVFLSRCSLTDKVCQDQITRLKHSVVLVLLFLVVQPVELFTGRLGHKDGGKEESTFHHPSSICVLTDESILVSDTLNNCIRRISQRLSSFSFSTMNSEEEKWKCFNNSSVEMKYLRSLSEVLKWPVIFSDQKVLKVATIAS